LHFRVTLGHDHMSLLRAQKAIKRAEAPSAQFGGLADAWDSLMLRVGDRVQRKKGHDEDRQHKNQLTMHGLLRVAFQQVGSVAARRCGQVGLQDRSFVKVVLPQVGL
jgi:hypothetical protein